jgi:molybdopterin molybdotransferase
MLLSFEQALATVKEKLAEAERGVATETLPLDQVWGRILAEDVLADRDYPPFDRSTRDGFAVRAEDVRAVPVTLACLGEARAGESFPGAVGPGQCVEIMTGAPLPAGADAVVMVEHVRVQGRRVEVLRAVARQENVVRQGAEATKGSVVLLRGRRLGAAEMGLLASVGRAQVKVFLLPRVAILATGDEVIPIDQRPGPFQIRNSNAIALAAQVTAAGGVPWPLGIAPDEKAALRCLVEKGLEADLLLLSGGVSVGKYDFGGEVLRELGGELFIQGVAMRPGKPLAFGRVRGKFFFGLPGNPVSTLVTFQLFVRPTIAMLGGGQFESPVFLRARLGQPYRRKLGLTAFVPARVEVQSGEPVVTPVAWRGSGDLVGVAGADCFVVIHPPQEELAAGDWVDVLPKPV